MHTSKKSRLPHLLRTSALSVGLLSIGVARAEAPPPELTVEAADRTKMRLCSDGKSHVIAVAPHDMRITQLYYGDAKALTAVMIDPSGMVSGNSFFDPRFPNPTANPSFRGIDWRVYSSVDFDAEKNTCALSCGQRKLPLSVMPEAEAQKLLKNVKFLASPRTREPHAFARDESGVYYFVDSGNTPETAQNFRVFVGRKGAMKLQKMKDVAADSEGEVFSTATGDLRFISTKDNYTWVSGKVSHKLTRLPIADNLTLIYTTLGVYSGQRMGTPCDDM